jgi:hypothetical protein
MKTPIWRAHKEGIVITAADVSIGLKGRPTTRVAEQLVVAHHNLVQLRPTVDVAFKEAVRLQRLQHAVVIKIGQTCIPSPTATRKIERLASINVRRDALLH